MTDHIGIATYQEILEAKTFPEATTILKRKLLMSLSNESIDEKRDFLAIYSRFLKLGLLDLGGNLEYVELLRFNMLSELMSKPEPMFILCFIKDFGPLSLIELQKEIQIPNNGVDEYIKTFIAAGFVESDAGKFHLSDEGEFYLSTFGSIE